MNQAGRVHGRKHKCAAAKCESSGGISGDGSGGTDARIRGDVSGWSSGASMRPRHTLHANDWRRVKGRLLAARRSRAYRSKHSGVLLPLPTPRSPRDFGTPLSRRPERVPWAGFFVGASTHSRRQFLANAAMAASRVAS
jgi:hypothetical protein